MPPDNNPRKTVIFGNGLGMVLDPEYFLLCNAIQTIWEDEEILCRDERKYILSCLPNREEHPPSSEAELDTLQRVVSACVFLNKHRAPGVKWLNRKSKLFPKTIAKFVHKVATHLFGYEGNLPHPFAQSLCDFIKRSKSHIATLNYDKLIYNALIENDVFDGYDGFLVDGMLDAGFEKDNMERRFGKDFGYYMHLHGSPLFINDDNKNIIKLPMNELSLQTEKIGRHIVLTHVKHKPSVIATSPVLSAYWEYLQLALEESKEILLFGYSGIDDHLTKEIRYFANRDRKTRIVEWDDPTEIENRQEFWESKLGENIELIQLDDITEFSDW